jgi:thioredoxin 1
MARYFFIVLALSLTSVFNSNAEQAHPGKAIEPSRVHTERAISTKPVEPKSHGQVVNFEDYFHGHKPTAEVAETAFNQYVLQSPLPVVVKFFRQGCGQCESVKSIFKQLAENFAGRIIFMDIDSGKFHELSGSKDVKSMPTIIYIHKGKELARDAGPQIIHNVRNQLKEHFEIS